MNRSIFIALIFAGFLMSSTSVAQIVPYDSDLIGEKYEIEVATRRLAEDRAFRDKETTLLSEDFFARFTGLNYFPIDIKYRIVGKLTRLPKSEKMDLDMSIGSPYGFMHFGKVNFFIDGDSFELQVFEFPSRGSLPTAIFVPFKDLTTGAESFGGGRFMIISIPEGEQIIIDFNLAINPICVYDTEHSCPVAPRSNFLNTRIEAGAKMYFDPEEESVRN